ncbi:MAG TPA: 4-hydroxybenzoate octaprenyltransferase [Rhodanobacteraceae bacterium]
MRSTRAIEFLLRALPTSWRGKARDYLVLVRMDRPVGALLLLWPTWWALWLAAGDFPPWQPFLVFTAGVFLMRSAGCAINDYADRNLDPQVQRTAGRPLAAGRVKPGEALLIFVILSLVSFLLVLAFTNVLTIELSFVGAALAALYPFSKRYTSLPQVVLGAAFGWGIPMAFAAITHSVPPLAWLLFLGNVLFSTIYDTEYAMVDREDDLRAGARSTAILFGDADLPILAILMGTFLLCMVFVGTRADLAWPHWLALAIVAGLFAWQLWTMRDRARAHCFAAFRNNNWVGCVLWVGILFSLAIK